MKHPLPTLLPTRNLTLKQWKNMSVREAVIWWEARVGVSLTKVRRKKLARILERERRIESSTL